MSVKISELPILDSLADNDIVAGVDVSGNVTSKIEMGTLKNYIDTNTQYTAGTNIDITNNVVSAPNVYNKDEMDSQIEELQSEVDSLSTIFNAFPTESGEGESLTLDDTAEVKFKKFDLKGNTSQDGTPTPSSPIPVNVVSGDNEIVVCGKNLFDKDNTITSHYFSNSNGSFNHDINAFTLVIPIVSGETYTISSTNRSIVDDYSSIAFTSDLVTSATTTYLSSINWSKNTSSVTFTTPNNAKYIYVYIKWSTNSTVIANTMATIQLEKGSSASTYEPYQGNTYNIDLPVENLLQNNLTSGNNNGITYVVNEDKSVTLNGTATAITWLILNTSLTLEAGTYTMTSGYLGNDVRVYSTGLGVYTLDGQRTVTKTSSVTGDVSINIASGTTCNNLTIKPMIEKSTKANSYTPYGITPMKMCKIGNYQDYFYKDSDKWYLHKEIGKVVLNGSESVWAKSGASTESVFVASLGLNYENVTSKGGTRDQWLTDYFHRGTLGTENTFLAYNEDTTWGYRNLGFSISTSLVNDIGTWKTWLSNNNISVYYPLQTPTNTQITYQPLIDQLNLLEQAMSKDGQTNISQINNDKPFIINAEAILSLKNVLDRIELLES